MKIGCLITSIICLSLVTLLHCCLIVASRDDDANGRD